MEILVVIVKWLEHCPLSLCASHFKKIKLKKEKKKRGEHLSHILFFKKFLYKVFPGLKRKEGMINYFGMIKTLINFLVGNTFSEKSNFFVKKQIIYIYG